MTKARFVRDSKSSAIVRDPKGNALSCVLLRVIERDDRGPRLLRYCYDDETINLAGEAIEGLEPEGGRTPEFLVTWSPTMAETNLELLQSETNVKADRMFGEEIDARDREIEHLRAAHARLVERDAETTMELRMLHHERDPKRFETAVRERVEKATAELEAKLRSSAVVIENQARKIDELQRGKKKLREALDRLKDAT